METARTPCVYLIGLDAPTARAVYLDLAHATIRRLETLGKHGSRRYGRRPDMVLLDVTSTNVAAEVAAVRATWGERVVIVGVLRHQPVARVWREAATTETVEIGPGFLAPFLPTPGLAG